MQTKKPHRQKPVGLFTKSEFNFCQPAEAFRRDGHRAPLGAVVEVPPVVGVGAIDLGGGLFEGPPHETVTGGPAGFVVLEEVTEGLRRVGPSSKGLPKVSSLGLSTVGGEEEEDRIRVGHLVVEQVGAVAVAETGEDRGVDHGPSIHFPG